MPSGAANAAGERELREGVERIELGELDDGVRILGGLLTSTPSLPPELRAEARAWLGHAYTRMGYPQGALAEYERALADAPADPWLHYALGIAHETMGDLRRARESFGKALALDPCHVKALQWRAEVCRLQGDAASALADLDRAVACLERADDALLLAWGASRRELFLAVLDERIEVLDELGEQRRAEADRERREGLRGER